MTYRYTYICTYIYNCVRTAANQHSSAVPPRHIAQAYPQLEVVTSGLVAALGQRLTQAKKEASAAGGSSPVLMVAGAFMDVIKPLAAAYISYASGYEETSEVSEESVRWDNVQAGARRALPSSHFHAMPTSSQVLLARPEFAALSASPTLATRLAPLTLAQHLHAPFDAMQRYQTQLEAVLEATPDTHPDHQPLLVCARCCAAT
jgi:hypothetical protein